MPPSPPERRPSRLPALDGLRGLAALAVVVLHVWMFDYGDAGKGDKTLLDRVIGELRLGVPLFFVLSGFFLWRAFAGRILDEGRLPAIRPYLRARAARILPAYWVALAGAIAITAYLGHPRAISADQLPAFLLFAHNQIEATAAQLNPPLWTLGVEVSFYLGVPLLALAVCRLGARRRLHLAVLAAVAAGGMACTWLGEHFGWPRTVTTSLVTWAPHFAAGMAAAVAVHGRGLRPRAGWALVAAGALLVVADAVWYGGQLGPRLPRVVTGDALAALGFALAIAGFAGAPLRARALTCAPARLLGDLSYAMYLWHFPIILWLRGTGHWSPDLGVALGTTVALTVAVAATSWLLVERPVLQWAKRRRAPRPRAAPRPRSAPARALAG